MRRGQVIPAGLVIPHPAAVASLGQQQFASFRQQLERTGEPKRQLGEFPAEGRIKRVRHPIADIYRGLPQLQEVDVGSLRKEGELLAGQKIEPQGQIMIMESASLLEMAILERGPGSVEAAIGEFLKGSDDIISPPGGDGTMLLCSMGKDQLVKGAYLRFRFDDFDQSVEFFLGMRAGAFYAGALLPLIILVLFKVFFRALDGLNIGHFGNHG